MLRSTTSLTLRATLGRGTAGRVYLADWNGTPVAAKLFDDPAVHARELALALRVRRRWGPSLRGCGVHLENGKPVPFLAFDLCQGPPLDQVRAPHPADRRLLALHVAHAVGRAIDELHGAGLRHGDVKRANVLVHDVPAASYDRAAERSATLVDLSLGAELDAPLVGISPRYAPPDLRRESTGRSSDLFAFGLLLLEVLRPEAAASNAPLTHVTSLGNESFEDAVRGLLSAHAGARPSPGYVADLAARLLGLLPCADEHALARRELVRTTYMALRSDALTTPFEVAPEIVGPPREWLEHASTLIGGPATSRVAPLEGLAIRQWVTALVGTSAAHWPILAIGEGALAQRLLALADQTELGAVRLDDLRSTVVSCAVDSGLEESGDDLSLPWLVRRLTAPRPTEAALRRAEAVNDDGLAVVLGESLLRLGQTGRARVALGRAVSDLGRATLAEVLRRADEAEAALSMASALVDSPDHEARDLACAVVARLAWDRGDLGAAREVAAHSGGARSAEVLALVAYTEGRFGDGLECVTRALADSPPAAVASRLFATRGMLLHGAGVPGESVSALRRAVERAEEAGAVVEEATYRTSLAASLADSGQLDEALEVATRALLSWDRQNEPARAARAWLTRAAVLLFAGQLHEARAAATCAALRAQVGRDERCQMFAELVLAESFAGDVAAAVHLANARGLVGEASSFEDRLRVFALELVVRVPDDASLLTGGSSFADVDVACRELVSPVRLEWLGARALHATRASTIDADEVREITRQVIEQAAIPSPVSIRIPAVYRAECLARKAQLSDAYAALSALRRDLVREFASGAGEISREALRAEWGVNASQSEHSTRGIFSAAEMEDLAAVLSLLGERERLRPLFEQVVDALLLVTRAERGLLLLSSPDGALRPRVARNFVGRDLEGEQLKLSTTLASRAAATREPVVATDALSGSSDVSASVHALRLRSVLAVPLVARGDVVGVVYLDDRSRRASFGTREIAHVSLFAKLAAFAIADARDQARLRRALRHAERARNAAEEDARARGEELERARVLRQPDEETFGAAIVGRSAPMRTLKRLVMRVAASDISVLVLGESGTGKELVARAIHDASRRAKRPFVSENCAAVPETLLESTLFGHVRGAFTGASSRRTGLFDAADGGTLFLDEVGEMSLALQSKLLRALQDGEVRPVGAVHPHHVDVRIIAATNRDLEALVRAGTFREDLYYRLDVVKVTVPALRERKDDIALLVGHFVERYSERGPVRVTRAALAALIAFAWPGNVRQIENEVRRALVLAEDEIDVHDLTDDVQGRAEGQADAIEGPATLRDRLDAVETTWVRRALRETGGNQTRAAQSLGVSRFGLQKMMKRLGITKSD